MRGKTRGRRPIDSQEASVRPQNKTKQKLADARDKASATVDRVTDSSKRKAQHEADAATARAEEKSKEQFDR
jgi:F0F1-type ATP synthase membrane subunit b/b'